MNAPFKSIALIGRFDDARVAEAMHALAEQAIGHGVRVLVDAAAPMQFPAGVKRHPEAELAAHAGLLVAVGGDGTLLHAARLAVGSEVPLLGINRGRLGFLADISASEMQQRFDQVLHGEYTRDRRWLIDARIRNPTGPERHALALNDVVLQKQETGRMLDFETWIDGCFVNTHGGDGLVAATPTGSTAYALACGGPIVQPDLEALVLAPISPHTLSVRPIVISRRSQIEVRLVHSAPIRAQVVCDGAVLGDLAPTGKLLIGPTEAHITLLHPPGYDYYRILRSKLHWGRGARHGRPDP
jgi:NAD+ kinase